MILVTREYYCFRTSVKQNFKKLTLVSIGDILSGNVVARTRNVPTIETPSQSSCTPICYLNWSEVRFDMPKVRKSAAAPVGVISKVLRILEAIQGAPSGLGLKAISDLTGINKSTAHRFLKHLERENYLISTED